AGFAFPAKLQLLAYGHSLALVHEVENVAPDHLRGLVAEHLRHLAVHEAGSGVGVDLPDAFLGGLDDLPVARLTAPKRIESFHPVGDVLADADEAHDIAGLVEHRVPPGVEVPYAAVRTDNPLVIRELPPRIHR